VGKAGFLPKKRDFRAVLPIARVLPRAKPLKPNP